MIKASVNRLLGQIIEIIRELKRFPTIDDLKLKAWNSTAFPNYQFFEALGDHEKRIKLTREYCKENNIRDVLQYFPTVEKSQSSTLGTVYLYKARNFYKIGRTNNSDRRDREIKLQLPFEAKLVHRIETDDPVGIEKYWHNRFAAKRKNGEWFCLSDDDIAAFTSKIYM